jgi:hypothetical protein
MLHQHPTGLLENTQAGILGQLPGADPKTLHKHYDAGMAKLSAGSSAFLQVKGSGHYVNIDKSGWAIIVPSAQTKFVLVPYYEDHYVVVASGEWKGYYLSFNRNSYVGVYKGWTDARYWAVEPLNCSPFPGLYSFQSSGTAYLCCNGVKDNIENLIEIYTA